MEKKLSQHRPNSCVGNASCLATENNLGDYAEELGNYAWDRTTINRDARELLRSNNPHRNSSYGAPVFAASEAVNRSTRPPLSSSIYPQTEETLPIYAFRDQIIEHIRSHPVTCIRGETGCGKSTKVPQFILEDAINMREGGRVSIVVTQPRRIACIALAERVAWERGEELGESVGFKISGESSWSRSSILTFMTTGYFLQGLINDPDILSRYSHVILDEVHERSIDADLLSLVVKLQRLSLDAIEKTKSQPFKIIVMSATLQVGRGSCYPSIVHNEVSSRFSGSIVVIARAFMHGVTEF